MMAGSKNNQLVLASASPARRALLEGAGVTFEVMPAEIDEGEIRDQMLSLGAGPGEIAGALASAKAKDVADRLGGETIIIGADQILLFEGEIFEKPGDRAAARETLRRLRGKSHELISAVTAFRPSERADEQASKQTSEQIWACQESARLTMRDFSDEFLEEYISKDEGQCASVGAYRLEGRGAQLFSHIEGDFFTILGLPLLALLDFLRREGLVGA